MATIYKGYRMESDWREPMSNITVTSPSGKLVHVYTHPRKKTGYASLGMKWIDGLENREPDPDKPNFDAMMKCVQFAKGLTPDTRGETQCPLCGRGTVVCIKSSYNGHTRGQCSTPKCVGWIE